MAGPFDLTGQNIENTYQRVLQTPDGATFYDGTGSLVTLPSANVSGLVTTSSFNAFTASINNFTASYNTGSFSGSFIGAFTGSLLGTAATASYYKETDPIFTAKSASLATTGSNNFNGNQNITGSVTITGSLIVNDGTYDIVDTVNKILRDSNAVNAVDWQNKTLTGTRTTVDWGNNILKDNSDNLSIDWESRVLYANDGATPHIDWSNPSYMQLGSITESPIVNVIGIDGGGRIYYTASSAIGGGGSSTPAFPYTGSAIISGSLTVTGSTTSTLGFTGSLFGTASWANNVISASYAATSSRLNAANTSIFAVSSNRMVITASNGIIMNAGSVGVSLESGITITGDILPGPPITNNTSSWSLGSATNAWKDLYVSNGSINFVGSTGVEASITYNSASNSINFSGATVTIPTGSIVPTASYAATSSVLNTATTVGQNLITLANPSAISYPQINADNTVSTLNSTQLSNNLGFYTVNLNNDVSITALNTTLADVTGLSFPIIAGNKYKFTAYLLVTTSAANTGLKFGLNANVAVSTINYTTRHNNGTQTAQFLYYANALDGASTNAGSLASNHIAIMEGFLVANNTGTAIVRFGKASANAGTLTVKATSFIEYQIL